LGGSRVENNDLGQGPESFLVGKIEVGVVEEGVSLIEKEGVENDDLDLGQGPASFLEIGVGVLEEGVSLIEKEGVPSVENNDLGQGFVVGKE